MNNIENRVLKLHQETIFPDLNIAKGFNPNHVTSELEIGVLKYGHIKKMQHIKPENHMEFAIMAITGLSENDVNELSSSDAAELVKIVYENLQHQMELTQNFLSTDFGQNLLKNFVKLNEITSEQEMR